MSEMTSVLSSLLASQCRQHCDYGGGKFEFVNEEAISSEMFCELLERANVGGVLLNVYFYLYNIYLLILAYFIIM
jgi:hypothetical protein